MSEREQAMPCPSQKKIYDEGCYFGRHLLGRLVANHARDRAAARMTADGGTASQARMSGDMALSVAFNDHLQRTVGVAPRMYKP